jgi:hypothetical protein
MKAPVQVRWIGRAALPLAVAVLTAVCFLPALSGPFLNWDDGVNFLGNRGYRGLGRAQIQWAFTSVLLGHYIPLSRLTYSLNYVLGGMDPWGYHLVNVLLHAANAALFYVVARRLLAAGAGREDARTLSVAAAIAALVFGVHPLRVEPVAWITGRPDVLCATFVLLATWAYLRAVEGTGPARRGLILVSAAGLAAALLSKGAALPFPAALLLIDVYPLRRLPRLGWWALVREKIPFFVVTIAAAVMIVFAVRHGQVVTRTDEYGVLARLTVAAYSFVVFAARFFWPVALSPLYEMPTHITPLEPRFALAVGAALLVTAVLIILRRRWPGGLAAWTFSALMLAPLSVAVRKGADMVPDRYTYLTGLGFAMLVGAAVLGVIRLVRLGALARPVAWVAAVAGVVAFVGLGATSWSYSEIWRNSETLWRWALEIDGGCAVCHSNLGQSILSGPEGESRAAEAERLFRRAIALRPELRQAYFNLGAALVVQGRYAEAEAPLRSYMERAPGVAAGPERLGRLYLLQKRYAEAIPLLRIALIRRPDTPGIRGYLAEALQARARELRARGLGAETEPLLAESRRLEQDDAPLSDRPPAGGP